MFILGMQEGLMWSSHHGPQERYWSPYLSLLSIGFTVRTLQEIFSKAKEKDMAQEGLCFGSALPSKGITTCSRIEHWD